MKKTMLLSAMIIALALLWALPATAETKGYGQGAGGYRCPGGGQAMGPGWGGGRWGRDHCPGEGSGWGRGRGYWGRCPYQGRYYGPGRGYGWGRPGVRGQKRRSLLRGFKGMTPEQRKAWRQDLAAFKLSTLRLRQKLVNLKMELRTRWLQPQVDQARIRILYNELGQVKASLIKLRGEFWLAARQKYGAMVRPKAKRGRQGGRRKY